MYKKKKPNGSHILPTEMTENLPKIPTQLKISHANEKEKNNEKGQRLKTHMTSTDVQNVNHVVKNIPYDHFHAKKNKSQRFSCFSLMVQNIPIKGSNFRKNADFEDSWVSPSPDYVPTLSSHSTTDNRSLPVKLSVFRTL